MQIVDVEKWREIFSTLGRHKLRTGLTAFGVFWGIFMLTVLLGAGKGFENGVYTGFPKVSNLVWMWSGGQTQIPYEGMPVGRNIPLVPEDVTAILKDVPSVGWIYGVNSVGVWGGSPPYTVHKSKNGVFGVNGGYPNMQNVDPMEIVEGRTLNELDDREKRKVMLIGRRVRDQLFLPGEPVIGSDITVNGISFTVVGVFKWLQAGDMQQQEERVIMPNTTLRYSFNQVGRIGSFVFVPKPGIRSSVAEEDVRQFLHKRNKVSPDDKGVLGSFNLQDEADKIEGLFTGIRVFSWIVAVGTIFAGAVGVGNIMLIVVKERVREIGLRKALGATPGSIVWMIMQESVFITAVAGYAGLAVAAGLLELIANAMRASGGTAGFMGPPEVEFHTAITALLVLVVSGVLASLLPAAKAAAVNPITALQDE
ncbi:MAG TPA: ABC transporter permease [Steroidobacteraceae bacterium]|nr:ABC transporter permease [Steroidobacteraceae bacterium]